MNTYFVKEETGYYLATKPLTEDAIMQMARKIAKSKLRKGRHMSCSQRVYEAISFHLEGKDRETFCVLYLDNQSKIIAFEDLFVGTINSAVIYPREIARSALLNNATSIIISHNHPGGSLSPSDADINITAKIKEVLKLLDIDLLDHIIVSQEGYLSMLEKNLM